MKKEFKFACLVGDPNNTEEGRELLGEQFAKAIKECITYELKYLDGYYVLEARLTIDNGRMND